MAKTDRKEKKKQKRPTVEKRLLQDQNKHLKNQILKSRLRTALTHLEKSFSSESKDAIHQALYKVHSLADKGIKKRVLPQNKANRIKSKASKMLLKLA